MELYALVIWYMTQDRQEYGAITFAGRGEAIETFDYGDAADSCPEPNSMGGSRSCSRSEAACERRRTEILEEIKVGKSLIDRHMQRYTVTADKPISFDCVRIKIDKDVTP